MTTFSLLPSQKALIEVPHELPTDVALYQGGVGSGKTTVGVLLGYLLSRLYPGSRGLVGAATYTLLHDTTRERWRELVPKDQVKRWNRSPDNLVLKNGSQIWFRHLSQPQRLSSMEFNWIHVEEGAQVPATTFRALMARLRHSNYRRISKRLPRRYRMFITSNPEEHYGHLYRTFIEPDNVLPNFRYIRAATSENHFLLEQKPDYIESIRQLVDDEYAQVYLEGHTGTISRGRVYRNFDRERHLDSNICYRAGLPLHFSFDFNVDFMVALAMQNPSPTRCEVVDEIVLRHGSDTAELCNEILRKYGDHRAGLRIHGDATGYARDHRGKGSDYAIIRERLGHLPDFKIRVKARSANPSVRDRTNAVNFLFKNTLGESRLFIAPHCKYLIRSLEQSLFIPGSFEKEKVRDPGDPRFVLDHCGDALDYYVADEHPFSRERLKLVPYL